MNEKIKWYIHRTRSMSKKELLYRLNWKFRQIVFYHIKHKLALPTYRNIGLTNISLREKLKAESLFFFNNLNKNEIISIYKTTFDSKKLLQLADDYAANKFVIYGFKKEFGKQINWNLDIKTGKMWPNCYAGNIYHNDTRIGGIRLVWELNRHLPLYTLGKAYYLTNQSKYAESVLRIIESWIDQNPYLTGAQWFSPLEMAIRILSWSWSLQFILDYKGLDNKILKKILRYIYLQADYIYNNLSEYSSANNHLIGEAAGLVVAGSLYPFLRGAQSWKNKGLTILEREITKQIYPDGVGAEQAFNYQIFTLDFYICAYLAAYKAYKQFPKEFLERLTLSARFYLNICDTNHNVANVGDSDEGRVTELNLPQGNNFSALLNQGAIISKDGDLKNNLALDEKTFWFFGIDGLAQYNKIANKIPSINSKAFPQGGYCVLRGRDYHLLFDCGPLGYLGIAAHGHADSLSIVLSVDGKEFLTDPNTYLYHDGGVWRNYFRSTAAHNTIQINNVDQSTIRDVSIWSDKANSYLDEFSTSPAKDIAVAHHDGYRRLDNPIIHKREIIHNKQNRTFEVLDQISGDKPIQYPINIFFNLHPAVIVAKEGNNFELKYDKRCVKLNLDNRLDVKIVSGSTIPIRGWYSPRFGKKVKTHTIIGTINTKTIGAKITLIHKLTIF